MNAPGFAFGSRKQSRSQLSRHVPGIRPACGNQYIGQVTARALAQQTGAPFLTAEDISAEGVAECILRAHRHKKAQEE